MKILDVGCGPGIYVDELNKHKKLSATGVDIDPHLPKKDTLHRIDIFSSNFSEYTGYDVSLCFEVGEHLPKDKAAEFVRRVCQTAPVIYFSAAQPQQDGYGHINLQPLEYWIALFNRCNYILDETETHKFKKFLTEGDHMGWMRNNTLVFKNYGSMYFEQIREEELPAATRVAEYFAKVRV